MRKAADGRGLLLTVRRSKTDQEGTVADVRYLKNGAAASVWAIRPPAPADDASVLGSLIGQSIARRLAAAVRSAGIEGRITGQSGRVGSKSDRVRPVHRFNFPRLATVLVTAVVVLAACAQGPGTAGPRGPSDTAPTFAGTIADQSYTVGEAISPLTLPEASGGDGTLSYSVTPSVPGLTFTAATRTLSGTPTSAGSYDMTYQPVDGDNNTAASDAASLSFTITVQEPEPPDTAPTFAVTLADQTYTEGEAVSPLTLPEAGGGNGTLSYSLAPTVPGLTFTSATRTLSGTPTSAGSYDMTYQAVDGDDNTAASDAATLSFTIKVQEPAPPDTAPSFADTVANQTYTEGVAIIPLTLPEATGGNGTLSYSLSPTVPGLTFVTATRTLSGTPTSAGSYDMTYQAVDGDNNTAASDAATLTFTITVQEPEPPFSGTVFLNPNVITDTDPTAFETLTYTGTGTRLMFDRRTGSFTDTSAYLFGATYRDGLTIEMQVNAEFGSREAAELEAEKYAAYIGKIPTLLRVDVETSWIHRGDYAFGGGNRNILIHTGRGEQYENGDYSPGGPGNYVEEALLHEGVHTSLDETHAAAPGWLMAQAADPTFISTYARDYPAREDLAESFVPYVIVQYRADRTPAGMVDTINATIPNRIAYFDAELAGSWCPLVPEDCPATPYVGCSADAETWRGLRVCTEGPRRRLRPQRLRNGLQLAGRRNHRGVAAHDEGGWAGLYALLLHRIRYHPERYRCD